MITQEQLDALTKKARALQEQMKALQEAEQSGSGKRPKKWRFKVYRSATGQISSVTATAGD